MPLPIRSRFLRQMQESGVESILSRGRGGKSSVVTARPQHDLEPKMRQVSTASVLRNGWRRRAQNGAIGRVNCSAVAQLAHIGFASLFIKQAVCGGDCGDSTGDPVLRIVRVFGSDVLSDIYRLSALPTWFSLDDPDHADEMAEKDAGKDDDSISDSSEDEDDV